MALHRYGDFRVEVFYFDSPCRVKSDLGLRRFTGNFNRRHSMAKNVDETVCGDTLSLVKLRRVELLMKLHLRATGCHFNSLAIGLISVTCHPTLSEHIPS